LDVLDALAMAERRGRIDAPRRKRIAGFLRDLPVAGDDQTASQAWVAAAHPAARFRPAVYDAAYLELARRLGVERATPDQELAAPCKAPGMALLSA
jgi:predicted nucleic acid-binding protein